MQYCISPQSSGQVTLRRLHMLHLPTTKDVGLHGANHAVVGSRAVYIDLPGCLNYSGFFSFRTTSLKLCSLKPRVSGLCEALRQS